MTPRSQPATVVVTGGASGIGQAIVGKLAADGCRCVVVDRARPPKQVAGEDYVVADVSDDGLERALVGRLRDLGLSRIDWFVHCAGVASVGPFSETRRGDWQRVLRVNLEGTLGVTQALLPILADGGRIVLFSSGTVFKGPANLAPYVASKAGVIGFARSLATELGKRRVTVNVVAPGLTDTPMAAPLMTEEPTNVATRAIRRRAVPADIVGTVIFLLSDAAEFVTGQTICVDGGSVRH